jgi:hypothetical protein
MQPRSLMQKKAQTADRSLESYLVFERESYKRFIGSKTGKCGQDLRTRGAS